MTIKIPLLSLPTAVLVMIAAAPALAADIGTHAGRITQTALRLIPVVIRTGFASLIMPPLAPVVGACAAPTRTPATAASPFVTYSRSTPENLARISIEAMAVSHRALHAPRRPAARSRSVRLTRFDHPEGGYDEAAAVDDAALYPGRAR